MRRLLELNWKRLPQERVSRTNGKSLSGQSETNTVIDLSITEIPHHHCSTTLVQSLKKKSLLCSGTTFNYILTFIKAASVITFQKWETIDRHRRQWRIPSRQNFFIFMQFLGKNWPNNRLALPLGVGTPPLKILKPPLEGMTKLQFCKDKFSYLWCQ